MLKAAHLGRYKDLALLLTRYGMKDFRLKTTGPTEAIVETSDRPLEPDVKARADAFVASLKDMGPSYVKFGQILSTRADIVPPEYIAALESLQDQIEPFPYDQVEAIVEVELGARISKAFESFDREPIAAASLGQVHRARTRNGRDVVVKIQRPNIREVIEEDLKVFAEIADFLEEHTDIGKRMDLRRAAEQAAQTILRELNYRIEARNIETFRRNLAEFTDIYIPPVIFDYTTERILTTEFVQGSKISKISPLALVEHDYSRLAEVMTHAYLKQICVDGFWHSDPHPGNVFVSDGKLVLLDFGMTNRISGEMQDQIIKLLLAVSENRGKEAAEICLELGTRGEKFSREPYLQDVGAVVTMFHDADLRTTNTGQLLFALLDVAKNNDVRLPGELAALSRTLLYLDGITRKLDPDFDPNQAVRNYAERMIGEKIRQKFHPRALYTPMLDANDLLAELPKRSREILDQIVTGKISFSMKLTQMDDLMSGLQRIANRIAIGLVIAALIIGSSLMLRVPSRFTLFGYPGLAVVGYIAASAIGFYLVVSTLMQDRRDRRVAREKSTRSN
jgi:ubiquinone biosynthesis protein